MKIRGGGGQTGKQIARRRKTRKVGRAKPSNWELKDKIHLCGAID